MESPIVLLLAAGIDYLIGDPWGWPHPVRVMGWVITHLTRLILQKWSNPNVRRWAGIFLGLGIVTGSGWVGWLIGQGANWLHPWLGIAVQSIVLASCFAGKSLRKAAEDVLLPLEVNDILKARDRLSQYVGRDTENLSATEILRAILETVTENATDGVMAPLFYAILGAALPGVGCLPFALAYKAASTLDSMVGYREPPYTDLGWFSARLEDTLSWVPCRLTVITLGLISGKLRHVWQLCSRDAIKDVSPNSGWSECAYAAILGVQMGGENWYRGVAKYKPLLGDAIHPITSETIHQALQLTRYSFLVWLGLAIALLLILNLG
jgi:adenosylcobinamide-phosphate synthase